MSKEITTNRSELRSGFEFSRREKAYHSYMYTLQNRNYGTSVNEYATSHNLIRDTLRGWINRYPGGKPFYDADDMTAIPDSPANIECQMVKLSKEQLVPDCSKEITDIRRTFSSPACITIKFYDSEITADRSNIGLVLSTIRSISNGQGL